MSRECTVASNGCIICPSLAGTPGQPGYIALDPRIGWNAGANSVREIDGTLYARNIQAGVTTQGVIIGFRGVRVLQTQPETITHGIAFLSAAGVGAFRAIEYGQWVTTPAVRTECDAFELRRYPSGLVRYYRNGTQFYESSLPSDGPVLLTACLYLAGDRVGGQC